MSESEARSPMDVAKGMVARKAKEGRVAGSAIQHYRFLNRLTQREAAKRLGIDRRTLQRYESKLMPVPPHVYIMLAAGCWTQRYDHLQSRKKIESFFFASQQAAEGN
jgi:transcriptional regulator with XRE-family HTH domain